MTTTAQMMADAIDINTRCCGRDCTDCPRKVSAELRRLDAVEAENKRLQQAHDIACEIGAQYADERDQLRAQVERLQGGEPTHWRAVLAEEQRPHELRTDRHILLFRKKRDAESWIASALDFDGWRYSLEPLYTAQPAARADSEPFGYFRADAMGWTDCAATDEGAIALYERPAAPAVPQGLEPAGFLLHWPAPGGSREIIWSDSRISGDAIGCPVTPVFKLSAPSQPVTLTDGRALKDAFEEGYFSRSTYNDVDISDVETEWAKSSAKASIAALREKGALR